MDNKIAIVVQRYGKDINGGAEVHARMLAEHLKEKYDVTVLTSCCLDYHNWGNHYPEGEGFIDNVRVLRFANESRNQKAAYRLFRYLRGNWKYYHMRYTLSNFLLLLFRRFKYRKRKNHDQIFERWIEGYGPVCKRMISYIAQESHRYKAFIFFTYLFYPTYFGLQKVSEKSILIPLAHDEPTFYFTGFAKMFSLPKLIMYNTESEKQLVESIYPVTQSIRSDIAGVGFDFPVLDENTPSPIDSPYVVYIGRIDVGKGCLELINYFSSFDSKYSDLKLVMIGENYLKSFVKNDNIIFTGFIDETKKLAYLQHCQALVIPSRYESLSMVTLEALSVGKPVLANGYCDVLKKHVEQSRAGFIYYNEKGFGEKMDEILNMKEYDKQLIAQNGKLYIEKNYQWASIMKKFKRGIDFIYSDNDSVQ